MSNNLDIQPINSEGFWGFISNDKKSPQFRIGGFISTIKIGPFDYLRLDYPPAGVWYGFGQLIEEHPDFNNGKTITILFPANDLPVITISTREAVYGD